MDLKDFFRTNASEYVYIHVPFCTKRCPYCTFFSSVADNNIIRKYEKTLLKIKPFLPRKLKTIYFGGGTPSLLSEEFFEEFLKNIKAEEITVEGNPESLHIKKAQRLIEYGVNRFSIGVQSFDDNILKILGRQHKAKDSHMLIDFMNKEKINYSVDFIIGISPKYTQTESIEKAVQYNVPHISVYMLELKEGKNLLWNDSISEDFQSEEFLQVSYLLKGNGYLHYEISNYALNEKYISLHNFNYWTGNTYIGIGSGASGFNGKIRYKIKENIRLFIEGIEKNEISYEIEEFVNDDIKMYNEKVMLNLRTYNGLDLDIIRNAPCNKDFERILKFCKEGELCREENGKIYLTNKGFLLFNYIISELLC